MKKIFLTFFTTILVIAALVFVGNALAKTATWSGNGTTNGFCSDFQNDSDLTPGPGQQGWLFILTSPDGGGSYSLSYSFSDGTNGSVSPSKIVGSIHFIVYTSIGAKLLSASSTGGTDNSVLTVSHCRQSSVTPTPTTSPTPTPTGTITPTPTLTLTPTPTTGPDHHYACEQNACVLVSGSGNNTCNSDYDCKQNSTPTPTDTPNNPGGPGGGGSDNLGCSTHDCSNQSHPTQAVLGLSTTSGENMYLELAQLIAAFGLSTTGFYFFKKNAN